MPLDLEKMRRGLLLELFKGFKGIALTLSEKKCLKESAKNLYKMLRYLDKKNVVELQYKKYLNLV